jgi:hypothetical protein
MGRLSQIIWYMNAEKHPTELEKLHLYTHLEITESLKKERAKYLRLKKSLSKQQNLFDKGIIK